MPSDAFKVISETFPPKRDYGEVSKTRPDPSPVTPGSLPRLVALNVRHRAPLWARWWFASSLGCRGASRLAAVIAPWVARGCGGRSDAQNAGRATTPRTGTAGATGSGARGRVPAERCGTETENAATNRRHRAAGTTPQHTRGSHGHRSSSAGERRGFKPTD